MGLVFAISVGAGGFIPGGTDSSGYISAGDLWRRGDLYRPEPLHFWATWPNATESASPVAYRAGAIRGTEVSVYPPGFPMLIAAAVSLIAPLGGYLVAPFMGAVLTWCTFALGRELGGNLAGLIAAALIASSPIMLYHTVHPMSDVPAAACWTLAWLMALRGRVGASVAAGLAAALAILIRPNLAPLAVPIGALVLVGDVSRVTALREWRWRAGIAFAATATIGPLLVAWSQAVLYGGPLVPGYVEWNSFFRIAHIHPNLQLYPRLLSRAHTLTPLVGLSLVLLAVLGRPRLLSRRSRAVALSAGAILLINFGLLLPYLSLDDWPFLRFLLPGLTALFILFAGVLALITGVVWSRARWLAIIVPLVAAVVVWQGTPFVRYTLHDWRDQARILLMGHYLREVLPQNAIVLSFVHSGAMVHYTGREVVRLDLIAPSSIDGIVDELRRRGYHPVFVLDQALEAERFKQRFANARVGGLDWPPRAVATTVTSILYFDPADREPFLAGRRWAIDVLR